MALATAPHPPIEAAPIEAAPIPFEVFDLRRLSGGGSKAGEGLVQHAAQGPYVLPKTDNEVLLVSRWRPARKKDLVEAAGTLSKDNDLSVDGPVCQPLLMACFQDAGGLERHCEGFDFGEAIIVVAQSLGKSGPVNVFEGNVPGLGLVIDPDDCR